jgi:ribosomal protein L20
MPENFDNKLQALRERFIDNFPQSEEDKETQIAAFSALTLEEKLEKVSKALELLDQKETLLKEEIASLNADNKENSAQYSELSDQLHNIPIKREVLKHKQELLKNGELEPAKREKMKRQLTQLEIKRCKNTLDNKDCSKIEARIAHKKEIFKKVFG